MIQVSEQEFANLSALIMTSAGIQLDIGKEYLLEARLQPLLERYGYESYHDLYQQAKSDLSGKIKAEIIDAITINETYFFRDKSPFVLLENKIIPDIIDAKSKHYGKNRIPIKIWSAACSTGQEVYSIAIKLNQMLIQQDRYDISILGTDISSEAIASASYGKYNQFEIERGLDPAFLNKYFTRVGNGWRIKDEIRCMAKFSKMDLNQPFAGIGTFDVILCRNVAIYFPVPGKIKLFQKISRILNHGGALIVGGSESLSGLSNDFIPKHYLNGIFYQLRTDGQTVTPNVEPSATLSSPMINKTPKPVVPEPLPDIPPKPASPEINKRLTTEAAKKKSSEILKPEISPSTAKPLNESPEVKTSPAKSNAVPPIQPDNTKKQSLLAALQEKNLSRESLASIKKGEKAKKQSLLEKLREREEEQKNIN